MAEEESPHTIFFNEDRLRAGLNVVPATRHDTYPGIDPANADLAGKIVLVTGACKGLGKGIAIAFSKAGVSGLALLARSDMFDAKSACIAAQRPGQALRILAHTVDTTNGAQVTAAIERVRETFGRFDVLVNNAGLMESSMKLIGNTDPDEWWNVYKVVLLGTYRVTHAFLPLLVEGGGNTCVHLNSQSCAAAAADCASTQMTKLAICRFTEQLVLEYHNAEIISLTIHPGFVKTGMGNSMPAAFKHLLIDMPELTGNTLVWLAKERREWPSGRYVSCQWDVDELLMKKDEIVTALVWALDTFTNTSSAQARW
ncbi:NAD(P)-binding protein [Wolfiporia cocos MD-104 SS10]|uniref:NAD(P)-binding protein n=1 Tax=Wolfiporia cocos (strain MD-104) TaxID=742152 RepID=A0A2H3J4H4_WOLCO|nr:NAD(P)-binding protein [Wolfiporia cocos MD-104 SS10]